MQITINTADILGNEGTIREEVIREVATSLLLDMRKQAAKALSDMLDDSLRKTVQQVVSEAVAIAIDTEFTDVDEYGRHGKTATVRSRIAGFVQEQCTFKRSAYSSEKNRFTSAVEEVVRDEVSKFSKEFSGLVTKKVVEESMDMAVKKLREALGIKA